MAGKTVGIDWYRGSYAVLEKIQGKIIPIINLLVLYLVIFCGVHLHLARQIYLHIKNDLD